MESNESICLPKFSSASKIISLQSRLGLGDIEMFDPDAAIPRPNRSLIYFGACIIAGLRLAREKQVNVRVIPTSHAIDESVDLAHEIFNRVFRKAYQRSTES